MQDQDHLAEKVATLRDALKELHDAVEARADIGDRRQKTVSPRMEDALAVARPLTKD